MKKILACLCTQFLFLVFLGPVNAESINLISSISSTSGGTYYDDYNYGWDLTASSPIDYGDTTSTSVAAYVPDDWIDLGYITSDNILASAFTDVDKSTAYLEAYHNGIYHGIVYSEIIFQPVDALYMYIDAFAEGSWCCSSNYVALK